MRYASLEKNVFYIYIYLKVGMCRSDNKRDIYIQKIKNKNSVINLLPDFRDINHFYI